MGFPLRYFGSRTTGKRRSPKVTNVSAAPPPSPRGLAPTDFAPRFDFLNKFKSSQRSLLTSSIIKKRSDDENAATTQPALVEVRDDDEDDDDDFVDDEEATRLMQSKQKSRYVNHIAKNSTGTATTTTTTTSTTSTTSTSSASRPMTLSSAYNRSWNSPADTSKPTQAGRNRGEEEPWWFCCNCNLPNHWIEGSCSGCRLHRRGWCCKLIQGGFKLY